MGVSYESREIAKAARTSLATGEPKPITGTRSIGMSERCVEIPWVAAHIGLPSKLLDIGWTMSPYEWISVILSVADQGCSVTGIDIVDPRRVRHRYDTEHRERVLNTPVVIEDFLTYELCEPKYDVITCVSTLEHIGFDVGSPEGTVESVFERHGSRDAVPMMRDDDTDSHFLEVASRLLARDGLLFITVPVGAGKPILHQDSLGYFTAQYEYGVANWSALTRDRRYDVVDEAFFKLTEQGWVEAKRIEELTGTSSELLDFATGCALVALRRTAAS